MAVATQGLPVDPFARFTPRSEQLTVQRLHYGDVKFDPKKHLSYVPPREILTMQDLGFPKDIGVSPVAVSQPFQLFSEEAIDAMRAEIFQKDVQENCTFSSNIAARQLRGYAKKYAPFTLSAWNDANLLRIISDIAGVDLVPIGDYEIGHINHSMKTEAQVMEERKSMAIEDEGIAGCHEDQETKPIVGWHTDSYPFVCVLMLSDCKDMVGGETAIRTADGQCIKVRGPTKGCAVIMQGRYLTHQAMRARGARERITSVTSFRPKSAFLKDDSVLRTVRPVSHLDGLYSDFAGYRLEMVASRVQQELKRLAAGGKFDVLAHKKFLEEIIAFAEHTNREIVEETKVEKGYLDEEQFVDAKIESDSE